MYIYVGHEITLYFYNPTPVVMLLNLHPSVRPLIRKPELLRVKPAVPITFFTDLYGNQCSRVMAPVGEFKFRHDVIVEDDGLPDPQVWEAEQHPIQELPNEVAHFLLASRYCEVDSELSGIAHDLFLNTAPGWTRVVAISNYVNQHLRFDYQLANPRRTAMDAYREKVAVCRDYMHLAITFCRALGIPARYCTGYLGDFGVPLVLPMDFSAWFEVYLGGKWHAFDARNNMPRIGRILMATGRDATDVALTTTFGANQLIKFDVWSDEVTEAELHPGDWPEF